MRRLTKFDPNDPLYAPADTVQAARVDPLLADRLRVSQIMESDLGRLHPHTAAELALRSPMSADAALAVLKTIPAPVVAAASGMSPYERAMNLEGPSGLHPGAVSTVDLGDPRAARMAELCGVGRALGRARGYKIREG